MSPGEWDNISVCCGIAGQAQFFLNVYDVTKDETYLDLVHRATTLMLSKGTRDAYGLSWTQAEHRTQPGLRVAQTGYMQGASGVGMWLLHLSAYTEGAARPLIVFPDSPFRY